MSFRCALRRASVALAALGTSGCWLALDLDDKQFTLGPDGGAGAGSHDGMVMVPGNAANAGHSFLIDQTEVTIRDYRTWLDGNPSLGGQDARCGWNQSFVPGEMDSSCPLVPKDELCTPSAYKATMDMFPLHPMACIDWCDARAYCTAHGKRLCGGFGGKPLGSPDSDEYKDVSLSEWYFACTGGDPKRTYPYGEMAQPGRCNDALGDLGPGTVIDVGSKADCVGGVPGLHDMSGNVDEWEDACYPGDEGDPSCVRAGGAYYYSDSDGNAPTCFANTLFSKSCQTNATGFRCCADPE